jgi:dynein light chain roadblock-type
MDPSDESLALLARLSSKPGVQSTLVLNRTDGAIVRSAGLLAREKTEPTIQLNGSNRNGASDEVVTNSSAAHTREEIARAVWKYVKATDGLVEEIDDEDELRLLRVRTKKNELVVVPSMTLSFFLFKSLVLTFIGSKFLLVIVHDTPPA